MTTLLLLHDGKTGICVSVPTLLEAAGEATSNGEDAETAQWFIVNLGLERGALELIDHYLHASSGESPLHPLRSPRPSVPPRQQRGET